MDKHQAKCITNVIPETVVKCKEMLLERDGSSLMAVPPC